MPRVYGPLMGLFLILSLNIASAEPRFLLAQQGDVMTASRSDGNREDACTSAVNAARNLCQIRKFYNVTRVNCSCSEDTTLKGRWNCVGTASCQE